jgi:hypothetical protein
MSILSGNGKGSIMRRMDIAASSSIELPTSLHSNASSAPRRIRKPTPRVLAVKGMHGQSIPARRFREIATALADDCGGVDKLSAPTAALIRRAASMTVTLEEMTTKAVAGEDVDLEQMTRLSNVLNRAMQQLGLRKRGVPKLTVPEYLAQRDARRTQG